MKSIPTRFEIYDDVDDVAAVVESFDDKAVQVDIKSNPHDLNSWHELSTKIISCIVRMTEEINARKGDD